MNGRAMHPETTCIRCKAVIAPRSACFFGSDTDRLMPLCVTCAIIACFRLGAEKRWAR